MARWKKKKFERYVIENLEIIDAGSEGKAVARAGELVVFVPYAVPGDVADIEILSEKKNFAEGRVTKLTERSALRVEPRCTHFGLCGGCKWQNMDYASQLFFKQKQVQDNFDRIGKFEYPGIMPILASGHIYQYRNKLEFTFSSRKWLSGPFTPGQMEESMDGLGFHLPGMFDRILDLQECHLQADPSDEIRSAVREYALENRLSFYNVKSGEGLLRNLQIRNTLDGQVMVIMVFSRDEVETVEAMMSHIRERFPELTSLMYVVNPKKNDDISDLEVKLFSGRDHLLERMTSFKDPDRQLSFRIGPVSFFQTNPRQAARLYGIAAEFAGFEGHETVYDLYTGTGTIACYIAPYVSKVVGVDYVSSAIADAGVNAALNGFNHLGFIAGDMARVLTEDFIREHGRPDIVITDPPRAGMQEKVVMQLLETAPGRIVYISCNPATQARDIALLSEKYMVTTVQPVDMFPHTQHVECVVRLDRREP